MEFTLEASGPVFQGGVIQREILAPVRDRLRDLGLQRLQDLTPVRSGTLQRGWQPIKSNPLIWANDVVYARYIDEGNESFRGVGITRQTVQYLEKQVPIEIAAQVGKLS